MAAGLLLAVAAGRQVGGVGEGGQQGQIVPRGRDGHLGLVLFAEGGPLGRGLGALAQLHGLGAGGQVGEPDVVPILAGEFRLGHAAGRAAHGTDTQPLVRETGAAETHDGQCHGRTYFSSATFSAWP